LKEKTYRYQRLLDAALEDVEIPLPEGSPLERVALDFKRLASSYYQDGRHFLEQGDLVNALVCFSYGHAWLDAGARLGVFRVERRELFTV